MARQAASIPPQRAPVPVKSRHSAHRQARDRQAREAADLELRRGIERVAGAHQLREALAQHALPPGDVDDQLLEHARRRTWLYSCGLQRPGTAALRAA
jgi:hypothetical protein